MQVKTYVDLIRPARLSLALGYDLLVVIGASLLMSASALIRIYIIPGSPVPITGQTFAVLFLATLLGSKRAPLAVSLYLLYGLLKLPWYVGGALASATGGYLLGFVVASFVIGLLAERGMDRRYFTTIIAMLIGEVVIFALGLSWLSFWVKENVFVLGLLPFIPGEIIKISLAVLLLPSGWKILKALKKDF